jgi:hypothetical protein
MGYDRHIVRQGMIYGGLQRPNQDAVKLDHHDGPQPGSSRARKACWAVGAREQQQERVQVLREQELQEEFGNRDHQRMVSRTEFLAGMSAVKTDFQP